MSYLKECIPHLFEVGAHTKLWTGAKGVGHAGQLKISGTRDQVFEWIDDFFAERADQKRVEMSFETSSLDYVVVSLFEKPS
jgi:hypothetical protein